MNRLRGQSASLLFLGVSLSLLLSAATLVRASGGGGQTSSFGSSEDVWPSYSWSNSSISGDSSSLKPFNELVFPASAADLNPFRNLNVYLNSFLFSSTVAAWFVAKFGPFWGHYAMCYCRNFLAGMVIYYGTASTFYYFNCVHPRSEKLWKGRVRPSREIILDQITMAQRSLFMYVALPVVTDFMIEEGWTRTYYEVNDIGGFQFYLPLTVLYFACVEVGIYWMHRKLHEVKFLYKHIHGPHHKYNSAETLTPFASIAFNPIDGILQASPYVIMLFFIPCHYLTHVGMVFCTAVWATFIHDAMDTDIEPIMGNKYHTIHHTHYHYNFGQIFTFCDSYWGTLKAPDGPTGIKRKKR